MGVVVGSVGGALVATGLSEDEARALAGPELKCAENPHAASLAHLQHAAA